MVSHDINNIINKFEEFNINEHETEIYLDKLYTDILIIIDKNNHEKLLLSFIPGLSCSFFYGYDIFDQNKHFNEEIKKRWQ